MHQRLLQSFAIHADDTPLVLLRPRRTAFAWVNLGDVANPYTLFDLTVAASNFPADVPRGFTGFVHAEAYEATTPFMATFDILDVGCTLVATLWQPSRAIRERSRRLPFIRTLYAVEKDLKDERARLGERFTSDDAVPRATNAGRADPGEVLRLARITEPIRDARRACCSGRPSGMPESMGVVIRTGTIPGSPSTTVPPSATFVQSPLAAPTGAIGGDGGLLTASVFLSVCASARRNHLNPWA